MGVILSFYGIIIFFFQKSFYEFDKNADSIYGFWYYTYSHKVSLATIGVCVFCAAASVVALFVLEDIVMK